MRRRCKLLAVMRAGTRTGRDFHTLVSNKERWGGGNFPVEGKRQISQRITRKSSYIIEKKEMQSRNLN